MIGFRRTTLLCCLLGLLVSIGSCTWFGSRKNLPVLSSSEQIRRLPAAEARRGYPVRLHGTVTFYDTKYHILTLQDDSGGVFVDCRDLELDNVAAGVRLDIAGYSGYEEYDPVVVKPHIRVGPPTLFPAARRVPMSRVLEGREDFQYVEIAAHFKSVSFVDNVHLLFVLEDQGKSLEAIVSTENPMPEWPAGTALLVRGVASVLRDAQGNPRSGRLHLSRFEDIVKDIADAGQAPPPSEPAAGPGPGLPLLTQVSQVKQLTSDEARKRYPVRIQAALNLFSEDSRTIFLQDSTGGIFVALKEALPPLLAQGDQIEVEGVSHPGDFAPAVHEATMRVLYAGSQFPPLVIAEPSKLVVKDENKWARVRGIAREVRTPANARTLVDLEIDGQHFPVDVLERPSPETYSHWIDAELEIDGVLGALFDQNRQVQGFQIIAPSQDFVKVTRPAPVDPYAVASLPLDSLLQYHYADTPRHRVKVEGTVSAARLGGTVHLASGGAGLRLLICGGNEARVGDRVEAVGFAPLGAKLPMLEAVELRTIGHGATERATDSNAEDLMTGAMDSRLVRLEAHLVGQHASYGDEVLSLQSGTTAFNAVLEQPQPFAGVDALRLGSMLRLTGVCEVSWDATKVPPEPVSFRLLLRSPSDIAVVQMASWWTVRNTLGVLASMAFLMAVALSWVFVLQRRVHRQTAMIAAKLEHETQLQAQLSQAQRLECVGRLAGGVAHDFNNLLTVINGYSDLALARLNGADPLRAPLDQIRRAGERAATLTQQLLGFSRKQIIQPKPVDLNVIVTEARGMLQPLLGELIKVRAVLQPDLGHVVADPGQIEQILMNLAANARDAMQGRGTLTIETRNRIVGKHERLAKSDLPPGSFVVLSVTDTGAGMSQEVQQHIFEPFFTTKERGSGTGLGLATVYGIVKQNGGWIEVYSELELGTAFHITLPRITGPNVAEEVEIPPAVTAGTGSLLLVEDEEDVRRFAVEVLEDHGYFVLAAADGEAALMLAENHPDPIDMLVTDVVLPGMNGRDLAKRLKSARPGVQVLFTSGYTQDVIAEHGILEHGTAYIAKPYTPGELAAKVQDILGKTPGNSE